MFAPIGEMPQGAIGVEAHGWITNDDRRILEPRIDSLIARGCRVRLLYSTGDDFAGYAEGGLLDEAVFGTRHFTAFDRIAFVGEEGPHKRAVEALRGLMPAQLRLFRRPELDAARSWLGEGGGC